MLESQRVKLTRQTILVTDWTWRNKIWNNMKTVSFDEQMKACMEQFRFRKATFW